MKPYQRIDGGVIFSEREYDIAEDTAVRAGQVVILANGLVEAAPAGVTAAILGVAAENHSGQADALSPRSSGAKLLVWDDPGMLFRCAAPVISASAAGSGGSITAGETSGFADGDFVGGYLMLAERAAGSANTDSVGTVRRIEGFAAGVFTVPGAGAAEAGDRYVLFPPVGFAKGGLNEQGTGLALDKAAQLPLRVIGRIEGSGEIVLAACKHTLAASV